MRVRGMLLAICMGLSEVDLLLLCGSEVVHQKTAGVVGIAPAKLW